MSEYKNNDIYIDIEEAKKIKDGLCAIFIDCWWVVTFDNKIIIHGGYSPQCNTDKRIAKKMSESKKASYVQIPVVCLAVKANEFYYESTEK